MSDTNQTDDLSSDEIETPPTADVFDSVEEVTVWAPEPGPDSDDIVAESIDKWIQTVDFVSTDDVPIPNRLVDQVIGQEAGSVVIKKSC